MGTDACGKVLQSTLESISAAASTLADLYVNNADMMTAFVLKKAATSSAWHYFGLHMRKWS
jgi:hypothetical protein